MTEDSDLLNGYAAIGAFMRWPTQTAKNRSLAGIIPTFKIGGTICARRSTLLAWIAAQEARGLHKGKVQDRHAGEVAA